MSKLCIYGVIVHISIFLGYAMEGAAQNKSVEQISIHVSTRSPTTLDKVIKVIEKESEFQFSHLDQDILSSEYSITLDSREYILGDLLRDISSQTELSFKRVNDKIFIRENSKGVDAVEEIFTALPITGEVTDENGEPLPGATVQEKGTSNGTITDVNGAFQMNVNEGAVLIISFVGYKAYEVVVSNQSSIDVQLEPDYASLEEVVVVGYGTQKKETVTGSVAAVDGEELAKTPTTNLSNTFAGRLPGVTAVQTSGEPGFDGSSIRIRGVNSYGNSDALIVIDGVPGRAGGLERLNPNDIESVSILKDAAAAIYGSRAANGVILITTKRGKTGKPTVSYDFNLGWSQPTRTPEMASAEEYAEVMNELYIYDNAANATEWAAALQSFKSSDTYLSSNGATLNPIYRQVELRKFANGSEPLAYPNTDWYDETLKTWSPQQRHNLQISGGTEDFKYLSSIGMTNQDGFYKNSATGYKQYDLRLNVDGQINDYIKTSIGILGRQEVRDFPNGGSAAEIFRMVMRGKPTDVAVWPNGLPGPALENGMNPVVLTTDATGYIQEKRDYIQTNGKLEIDVPWVEGLKVTGTAAVDRLTRNNKAWKLPWTLYDWDGETYQADGVSPELTGYVASPFDDPQLSQIASSELAINLIGRVDYNHTFLNAHTITAMVGVQKETVESQGFGAFRRNFLSPAIDELFAGGTTQQNISSQDLYQRARLSYFGRAGYNYKEKYLVEFLFRYDGSYLFPKESRFGFFPGVSAGWRISEEDFFNIGLIDHLKVRGSWGQMGAEPYYPGGGALAEYQYLSTMSYGNYILDNQISQTLHETVVPNNTFTWEVANNYNAGLEAGFFNSQLVVELDYFYNKRSEILTYLSGSIPVTSGITSKLPPVNYGKMENQGGEFRIQYNQESVNGLSYSVGVNGGYARNRIIDWNETPGIPEWQQTTGRPYGAFLLYQTDGVFTSQEEIEANTIDYSAVTTRLLPGDLKIKDYNNDGFITADDKVRLDKTNTPTFTYGITSNLSYKNFDLSILFQGAAGGLQFVGITESGDFGNFLKYQIDNRWSIENPSSEHPRLNNRSSWYWNSTAAGDNDYYVKPNNYLRLKNVELGYTLPNSLTERVGIGSVRVYTNGLNLLTFDKIKIWDPESVSANGHYYPQARIISAGLRASF